MQPMGAAKAINYLRQAGNAAPKTLAPLRLLCTTPMFAPRPDSDEVCRQRLRGITLRRRIVDPFDPASSAQAKTNRSKPMGIGATPSAIATSIALSP